jgi:hypothetical protein
MAALLAAIVVFEKFFAKRPAPRSEKSKSKEPV